MAQVDFEIRFESDGSASPEDVENTKALLKQWIAKKLFQHSFNSGYQVEYDLNIQLASYGDDSAFFKIEDGWAEPVLKYSIIKK